MSAGHTRVGVAALSLAIGVLSRPARSQEPGSSVAPEQKPIVKEPHSEPTHDRKPPAGVTSAPAHAAQEAAKPAAPGEVCAQTTSPCPRPIPPSRDVKDLWTKDTPAQVTPADAFDFASKHFFAFGVDVSVIRTDQKGNAQLGGEISYVPVVSSSVYWLGVNAWYTHAFIPKVNRIAFGLQVGRGPMALEFAPVLFAWLPDETHLGGSATLSFVIPFAYTRTSYSRACCRSLPGPRQHVRSCACDRSISAGYLVPYFRLELGERERGRREDKLATFFGLRLKYGVGY